MTKKNSNRGGQRRGKHKQKDIQNMFEVWRLLEETRMLEMELLYHQSDRLYQELLEQELARAKEEEGEDSVSSRIIEFPL